MKWLAVVVLSGCNALFGLDETRIIDAGFYDVPTDAPYACPEIGTLPEFSRILHQQVFQSCFEYMTSETADRVVARCNEPATKAGVWQGRRDDTMLQPISGLDDVTGTSHAFPVLTPDGSTLFLRQGPSDQSSAVIAIYQPIGEGWTQMGVVQLPFTLAAYATIGSPTRGPPYRMFVENTDQIVRELEIDANGVAVEEATYTNAELGLAFISRTGYLTADGLRMVMPPSTQGERTMYTDRAALSARFAKARSLTTAPGANDPFLTEDCSRLYFSSAGNVFYAQQP